MGISVFFRKVRALLEGDQSPDEIYTDDVKPERVRPEPAERSSDSAARLAERMAGEYVDPNAPDEDDDELYGESNNFYRTPVSYSDRQDDYSHEEDDYDDGFDELEDIEDEPEAAYEEAAAPVNTEPVRSEPEKAERMPTRTEVTLMQIERLSKKLDDKTLREYQIRLVRHKQETGAVSALTALRILHEYVDDDAPADGTVTGPDLSAK